MARSCEHGNEPIPRMLSPSHPMRTGREVDHSAPSSADVENAWSYTSTTPVYLNVVVLKLSNGDIFVVWYLFKHRYNFIFYLLSYPFVFFLLSHLSSSSFAHCFFHIPLFILSFYSSFLSPLLIFFNLNFLPSLICSSPSFPLYFCSASLIILLFPLSPSSYLFSLPFFLLSFCLLLAHLVFSFLYIHLSPYPRVSSQS